MEDLTIHILGIIVSVVSAIIFGPGVSSWWESLREMLNDNSTDGGSDAGGSFDAGDGGGGGD